MSELISTDEFPHLIQQDYKIIDVRSEIEFVQGHLPNSVNIPILNTDERAQVGTVYKKQGKEAALMLGQALVSGEIKTQRVQLWTQFIQKNEKTIITCFRGGLRSQIAQQWCKESGFSIARIKGGTKNFRNFLQQQLQILTQQSSTKIITGMTGSGKSLLIKKLRAYRPCLDLEQIANHRGSVFGGFLQPQPSQIFFENMLSCQFIKLQPFLAEKHLILEDESRLIGNCVLPDYFFQKMRGSPTVLIEEDILSRVQTTFEEYILLTDIAQSSDQEKIGFVFNHYQNCVKRISNKLGGLRSKELLADLSEAYNRRITSNDLEFNKVWIKKLLEWYYDPLYLRSLKKRNPNYIFRGNRKEVFDYLRA